jgi:shikimate kinase
VLWCCPWALAAMAWFGRFRLMGAGNFALMVRDKASWFSEMDAKGNNRSQPNLYLVGFMGTGKSAVGRRVARQLGFDFVDVDRQLEQQAGRSIAEIFAKDGEACFRQMERDFIEKGHSTEGQVVSCGGGLVVAPGMREALLARGVVVCLFASVETILERTGRNRDRPLLDAENPRARIEELLKARMPVYQSVGTGVCTDNRPIGEVVNHIVRVYKAERKHSGCVAV